MEISAAVHMLVLSKSNYLLRLLREFRNKLLPTPKIIDYDWRTPTLLTFTSYAIKAFLFVPRYTRPYLSLSHLELCWIYMVFLISTYFHRERLLFSVSLLCWVGVTNDVIVIYILVAFTKIWEILVFLHALLLNND